jgi:hypothetical protein
VIPKIKTFGWQGIIAVGIFAFFLIYWIYFQLFLTQHEFHHRQIYTFSSIYGIMALWGAICGLWIARKWGGLKSVLGKSLIFFSIGLLLQEFGQLAYSYYYIVKDLEVADYPGLGDIGFFGTIPIYCIAIFYLAKASGVALRIKSLKHVVPAVLITFLILVAGYALFLQNYEFDFSNPIKIFLDFGYPLGAAIYISLAVSTYILSKGVLGGVMRNSILFLLFALFMQFAADYTFLFQTHNGTWVDSGINDFIYFLSYFVMTLALIQFGVVYKKLNSEG